MLDKYHSTATSDKSEFESRRLNPYGKEIETETIQVGKIGLLNSDSSNGIIVDVVSNDNRIRIDKLISDRVMDISRSLIQKMIKEGSIVVNKEIVKAKYKVKNNDIIEIARKKVNL